MAQHFTEADLAAAKAAVVFAQQVRKRHRRRSDMGSPQRGEDIATALRRIRVAMSPLRSALGKFPHDPQTSGFLADHERVRAASHELQSERRKLHKMLSPSQREAFQESLRAE